MGNVAGKNEKSLGEIKRNVGELRNSVRRSKHLTDSEKNNLLTDLAMKRHDIEKMRGRVKRKKIEDALDAVRVATREVIETEKDEELDGAAIDSNSFVQVPVKKHNENLRKTQVNPVPSLQEIERNFEQIKPNIETSIQALDYANLRFRRETVRQLQKQLEKLELGQNGTAKPYSDRLKLELRQCFEKVDNVLKESKMRNEMTNSEYFVQHSGNMVKLKEMANQLNTVQDKLNSNLSQKHLSHYKKFLLQTKSDMVSIPNSDESVRKQKADLEKKFKRLLGIIEERIESFSREQLVKSKSMENLDWIERAKRGLNEVENLTEGDLEKVNKELEDLAKLLNNKRASIGSRLKKQAKEVDVLYAAIKPKSEKKLVRPEPFKEPVEELEKIKELQKEFNSLKRKSQGSNFVLIKNKCESLENQLKLMTSHSHPKVSIIASNLVKEVDDFLIQLIDENKGKSSHRKSIEVSFETIIEISDEVNRLTKKVSQFEGNHKDEQYINLKDRLLLNKNLLESLEVSSNYPVIHQTQNCTLETINKNLALLEDKASKQEKNKLEDEIIEEVKKELDKLKMKVHRFTGSHGSLPYTVIEDALKKLVEKVKICITTPEKLQEIMEELEMQNRILNSKAVYSESIKKHEIIQKLNSIAFNLSEVKKKFDEAKEEDVEDYLRMLSIETQKLMKEADEDTYQNYVIPLYEDIEQQCEYIKRKKEKRIETELKNKNLPTQNKTSDPEKFQHQLKIVEEKVEDLNSKVLEFLDVRESEDFIELESYGCQINLTLDSINLERNDPLFRIKYNLMNKTEKSLNLLEDKADAFNRLLYIEAKIENLLINSNFDGFEEQVLKIQEEVNKFPYYEQMEARKVICLNKLDDLINNIHEYKITTNQVNPKSNPQTESMEEQILKEIEKELYPIEQDTLVFVGDENSNKYCEIDEAIIRMTMTIDKLKIEKDSVLYKRKLALLKRIHKIGEILDIRTAESKQIIVLEKMVNEYEMKLQTMENENVDEIDEKLTSLLIELEKMQTNKDLEHRRIECKQKVKNLLRSLRNVFEGSTLV